MDDNKNQINWNTIKDEVEKSAADYAVQNKEAEIRIAEAAEKITGLTTGLQSEEPLQEKTTGLQSEEPLTKKTTGLQLEQPAEQKKDPAKKKKPAAKKKAHKSSKPAKKRSRRNQRGILAFIAVGLIGIIAASAWIVSSHKAEKEAAAAGKAEADIIAQGAETVGNVEIPEVRTRENVSNNFHVISHRGYPAKAEEHSFEGYDLALDAGTMYIEQDIVTSADGTLYVSHDDSPQRLTGTGGRFSEMTDAEIDALTTHAGNKILKLSDVFDRYGKSVGYVIELRDSKDATINAFCDLMDRYKMTDNVILQSFEADVLDAVEEKYPDMPKMYLCNNPDDRSRGIGLSSADIVCINKTYMNEFGANAVHNAGKKFGVWTIDAENHIMEAIRLGTDYYFTDDTGKALDLEKRYRNE